MRILQSFNMAIKSLMTSKVRALLTMLGIIIGVGAVITILSLGDGMNRLMKDTFESMGSNLINVMVWGFGSTREARPEDMYAIVEENPDLFLGVSPSVSVSRKSIKHDTATFDSTQLAGVGEDFDRIRNRVVEEGRFIRYVDIFTRQNVCVIGSYIKNEMFSGDAIGKTLRINGYEYTVIGVVEEKAGSIEYTDDDIIFIPYTNALKLNGSRYVSSYAFSSASDTVSRQAQSKIEERLKDIYGTENSPYRVMNMTEIINMASDMTGMMITVIALIAAISLLVGGIGIMNIMLVSVTERTREIGIRKSIGAKKMDIRSQFIIEALTTSSIGGVLGILLGSTLATNLGKMLELAATPSTFAITLSFGVSAAIGVLFGFLPANKAAMLNPIDALRYE